MAAAARVTLTSETGDRVELVVRPERLDLLIIPPREPFGELGPNCFQLGLNLASLSRLRLAIRQATTFKTADGLADVTLAAGRIRLGFHDHRDPSLRFESVLSREAAETVLRHVDQALDGDLPGGGDLGGLAEAALKRNAPCSCGSGRKFKRCCLRKPGPIPQAILRIVEGVDDFEVRFQLELARRSAHAENDPRYWCDLGTALSTAGFREQGEAAWRKALEIDPGEKGPLLNLAVNLSQAGKDSEALALIDGVPKGTPRRAVILANVLTSLARLEEAIPLYEEAIAEEPGFDLPYEKLVACLERTASPLVEYWLDRGRRAAPQSATLASKWCRFLFKRGRLEELAEADWIDRLESGVGDIGMADRRRGDPTLIVEAFLWRACGRAMARASRAELNRARELLAAYLDLGVPCEPAQGVLMAAVLLGDSDAVEFAFQRVCETCRCRLLGDLDYYLAGAASNRGDWSEVVVRAEACLQKDPENVRALSGYWWALDELGRCEEAIAVAERSREKRGDLPAELDSHLDYNIGLVCGKAGRHGRAQYYYEEQVRRVPGHPLALENLAVTLVLNGHPEKAEDLVPRWRDSLLSCDASQMGETSFRRAVAEREASLRRLVDHGRSCLGVSDYSLDVAAFRASLDPPVGSDLALRKQWVTLDEALQGLRHSDGPSRSESLRELEMQRLGDWSPLLQRLRDDVPGWDGLPSEARSSLLEGERRLLEAVSRDYAPEVVCFAKAVEISLKAIVFDRFKQVLSIEVNVSHEVEVALNDRFKQVHNLVRFIERGKPMELGTMVLALRLTTGRTANELLLLGALRDFIKSRLAIPGLTDTGMLAAGERLANLRNAAAHATSFHREGVQEARAIAVRFLTVLAAAVEVTPSRLSTGE